MRRSIHIPASTIFLAYISVILTVTYCDPASAQPIPYAPKPTPKEDNYVPRANRITDDVLANSIKAEYPSDRYKVVPREEVCIPPSPCGKKRQELTTTTLHEKLKYECPPCRKCTKELAKIKKLQDDISDYIAEIERLKKQIDDLENQAKVKDDKPVEAKTEVVDKNRKNFLYFSPMYTQDGIIATDKEGDTVYEAQPVESVMFGGGYTRFFELNESMNLGLGIGAHVGRTNFAINGQIGVNF